MYENVGKKIQLLAKIFAGILIVASVVGAIAFAAGGTNILSVLIAVGMAAAGAFIAWLSSLGIYGFGVILENHEAQRKERLNRAMEANRGSVLLGSVPTLAHPVTQTSNRPIDPPKPRPAVPNTGKKKPCPNCGALNNLSNTECFACHQHFPDERLSEDAPAKEAVPKNKKACPGCGAWNNLTNTICFACGQAMDTKEE